MNRLRKVGAGLKRAGGRILAPLQWARRTFDGRDLHLYGGLALIGYGLAGDFGSLAVAVPGALLFAIGVFGITGGRTDKGGGD